MYRTHLDKLSRTRLDDVLVDEGVLDRERLEAAQAESDQTEAQLSDVLVDSGALDEWDLAKLVASHYALPFVDVRLYSIQPAVLDLLSLEWCRRHSILPFDQFAKTITIACAEVPDPDVIEEIVRKTGCTPFLYVGLRRAIRDVIDENLKRRVSRSPAAKGAEPPAPVEELPPLPPDLPRVSLALNASAAPAGGRKSLVERFGRPTVAGAGPVPAHAPAPAAVAPSAANIPAVVGKVSPMQQLLARRTGTESQGGTPAGPAAPPRRDDPPRPRLSSRVAPVLPATPARPSAEPAPAAKKAAGPHGAWESIFDCGEEAVRSSQPGDRTGSQG